MINDVAVAPSGDAFFTDSLQPMLWRAPCDAPSSGRTLVPFEPWLPLSNTAIAYTYGEELLDSLNLNGIVVTADGAYLLTIQSNTGELFCIEIETRHVTRVGVRGGNLAQGDGLVLDGQLLYVVGAKEQPIVAVRLNETMTAGDIVRFTPQPLLKTPTTAALIGDDLLVVNSQLDQADSGSPSLPFTVSRISRI
jgi:Cu-Zn family superoxide dismutase